MIGFHRLQSSLACDGLPLDDLANEFGTPAYVYSAAVIRDRYQQFAGATGGYPASLHYALKANSTLAIVRLLRELGASADCNSGGEIDVALRVGFRPDQIVFTGVGKTDDELQRAVRTGVAAVNVESAGEVQRLSIAAARAGRAARLAIRINPDVDALSHPHISTGLRTNKFGVPLGSALDLYLHAAADPNLQPVGVHVHIGSQIVSVDPIHRAVSLLVDLAERIRAAGAPVEHLDVGGGLGISYDGHPVLDPADYVRAVIDTVRPTGLRVVFEPGRAIVAPAGALLTTVVDVKPQPDGKWFVVTDAGMTELLRPALYGAYHRIQPTQRRATREHTVDVVGPVCETSDTLGTDRHMPLPETGDRLAVLDAGAYGAVMASNYNRRLLPPEVLVDGGRARLVRRRQTLEDVLALEQETGWDG